MRRIFYSLFVTLVAVAAYAVPATPLPIEITLADGTTTQVYLHGDEYAHYHTLLDGTPVRLEQGKLIEDYTLPEITRQKMYAARQTEVRASDFPSTGSPKGLVILVNFADKKFIKTNEQFKAMMNQEGYTENGGIGSARDYFINASDSLFQPIFDVYGPYDLPHDMAYYGGNDDARASEMIMGACGAAESDGVDFSLYDANNDGRIDNVFVYYAGNNEAEGADENTVWPHRSYIPSMPQYGGKRLYDYACSSELRSTGKTMCGIGTFCHEFSHVLGLADLYDLDYKKNTVGSWDIMCSGSYNGRGCQPPSYTAFERFSVGWLNPTVLTEPGQYLLEPLTTHNQAYLIPVSMDKVEANVNAEYFLLENRQRVGWDAGASCLVSTGMLVWHIDYNAAIWGQNRPNSGSNLLCFIESATGNKMTSGSAADPFPGTRKKTMFIPTAADGTVLEKPLLDIKQMSNTISFVYIRDGNKYLSFEHKDVLTIESTYTVLQDGTMQREMPAQRTELTGVSLDPKAEVVLRSSNTNFQFSIDSLNWVTNLTLQPSMDSAINVPMYVRYRPTKQVCNFVTGNIQAQQGAALAMMELQGTAPRKTIITVPQASAPANITPYSAELNWKAVEDATHYYVTLYQIKQGETVYQESFEQFNSPSHIAFVGWQSNFNTLSSILQASGDYSLWFQQTGDQVITEKYIQPITQLSFWYSVPTTSIDTVGGLLVEGFDGSAWSKIDSITIKKKDRKKTFATDVTAKNYVQFRITFTNNEGGKGVCIDDYRAVCGTQIEYIYQGEDLIIEAISGEETVKCYIPDLQPSTEYFYKVRVSDEGHEPCEIHIKEMTEAQSFVTLVGHNNAQSLTYGIDSIHYNQLEHVIYVPEALGDRHLYFYDLMGQLIGQCKIDAQQNRVPLPEGNFVHGNVYIVKYSIQDTLKRKDRWIKFLY